MRYFGGLNQQEIAAALDVTDRTVRRDWEKARYCGQRLARVKVIGALRGAPSNCNVFESRSPRKYLSSTRSKTEPAGETCANKVALDFSLRSSGEPKICWAERPSIREHRFCTLDQPLAQAQGRSGKRRPPPRS